jgi:hypothetical protein
MIVILGYGRKLWIARHSRNLFRDSSTITAFNNSLRPFFFRKYAQINLTKYSTCF